MEASEARGTTRATRPHRTPLAKRQDGMGSRELEQPPRPREKNEKNYDYELRIS